MRASQTPRTMGGVPAQFALTLLHEVTGIGGDANALLSRVGLPFGTRDLSDGLVEFVADHQFVRLYEACITELSAHANLEGGLPPMSKDEVDMLCYCVINCATLAEVIDRAQRFCAMLNHRAADLSLEVRGGRAVFHMKTRRLRDSGSGLLTDLNGLSFYHRFFSWLIGEAIPVNGYEVFAEPVLDQSMLERFFNQQIQFRCPDNRFSFPAALLAMPVVRSYQRLVERLAVFPFDHLHEPRERGQLAELLEHIIATRLAAQQDLPTLAQFASAFNLSRATFQRRLAADGVTLEQLKQRVRRRMAEELLHPSARLKVSEVALRLGFSEARSFRRAFAGWTGSTPDAWRRARAGRVALRRPERPAAPEGNTAATRRRKRGSTGL